VRVSVIVSISTAVGQSESLADTRRPILLLLLLLQLVVVGRQNDYVTVCGFPLIPGSGKYVG